MMTAKEIRKYVERLENEAREEAARHDVSGWGYTCTRIWTAEFILDKTHVAGYLHPTQRIPYPFPKPGPK
jgi:hypothetical protein